MRDKNPDRVENQLARRVKPRPVDFFRYDEDREAAILGAMGFSSRFIAERTRLTFGKITYRLKKARIRRIDYRDGHSDMALLVLRNLHTVGEKQLTQHLKGL